MNIKKIVTTLIDSARKIIASYVSHYRSDSHDIGAADRTQNTSLNELVIMFCELLNNESKEIKVAQKANNTSTTKPSSEGTTPRPEHESSRVLKEIFGRIYDENKKLQPHNDHIEKAAKLWKSIDEEHNPNIDILPHDDDEAKTILASATMPNIQRSVVDKASELHDNIFENFSLASWKNERSLFITRKQIADVGNAIDEWEKACSLAAGLDEVLTRLDKNKSNAKDIKSYFGEVFNTELNRLIDPPDFMTPPCAKVIIDCFKYNAKFTSACNTKTRKALKDFEYPGTALSSYTLSSPSKDRVDDRNNRVFQGIRLYRIKSLIQESLVEINWGDYLQRHWTAGSALGITILFLVNLIFSATMLVAPGIINYSGNSSWLAGLAYLDPFPNVNADNLLSSVIGTIIFGGAAFIYFERAQKSNLKKLLTLPNLSELRSIHPINPERAPPLTHQAVIVCYLLVATFIFSALWALVTINQQWGLRAAYLSQQGTQRLGQECLTGYRILSNAGSDIFLIDNDYIDDRYVSLAVHEVNGYGGGRCPISKSTTSIAERLTLVVDKLAILSPINQKLEHLSDGLEAIANAMIQRKPNSLEIRVVDLTRGRNPDGSCCGNSEVLMAINDKLKNLSESLACNSRNLRSINELALMYNQSLDLNMCVVRFFDHLSKSKLRRALSGSKETIDSYCAGEIFRFRQYASSVSTSFPDCPEKLGAALPDLQLPTN